MNYKSVPCPGHTAYIRQSKTHINVGTIGHVDHGKTTLNAALARYYFSQTLEDEISYLSLAFLTLPRFCYLDKNNKLQTFGTMLSFLKKQVEQDVLALFEQGYGRFFVYNFYDLKPVDFNPYPEDLTEEKKAFYKQRQQDFILEKDC